MLGPLTYLDAVLVAICLLSGILAMYRGLSREVLSIMSWVLAAGAGFAVVMFQHSFAEDLAKQVSGAETMPANQVLIVKIGLGIIIAIITLVAVHLVTSRISDAILESRIGLIDRVGGLAFGVVRGFAIVLPLFMFYNKFVPEKDQHTFVTQAKSRPLLISAGKVIDPPLQYFFDRYLNKSAPGEARPG
ncbi:unnamed protein product [Phaeothamnion confervicola]